jgi:hypothetical protein
MGDNGKMNTQSLSALEAEYAQWLKQALAYAKQHKGLTRDQIAELAEINPTSLSKAKNGRVGAKGRALSGGEVTKLSRVTGYALPPHLIVENETVVYDALRLKLNLAAGVWREESKAVSTSQIRVRVAYDPAYESMDRYARLLDDDHAIQYAPKGFYLICVDYRDARKTKIDGDIVVVERRQPGGSGNLSEITVKELRLRQGQWYLDSLAAEGHTEEPILYSDNSRTLRILDLVISAYKSGTRM